MINIVNPSLRDCNAEDWWKASSWSLPAHREVSLWTWLLRPFVENEPSIYLLEPLRRIKTDKIKTPVMILTLSYDMLYEKKKKHETAKKPTLVNFKMSRRSALTRVRDISYGIKLRILIVGTIYVRRVHLTAPLCTYQRILFRT